MIERYYSENIPPFAGWHPSLYIPGFLSPSNRFFRPSTDKGPKQKSTLIFGQTYVTESRKVHRRRSATAQPRKVQSK